MAYTILMAAVLLISFALMIALVQFSEVIITRKNPESVGGCDAKQANGK